MLSKIKVRLIFFIYLLSSTTDNAARVGVASRVVVAGPDLRYSSTDVEEHTAARAADLRRGPEGRARFVFEAFALFEYDRGTEIREHERRFFG